jgi:hypothetical protein
MSYPIVRFIYYVVRFMQLLQLVGDLSLKNRRVARLSLPGAERDIEEWGDITEKV